jgi:hypothetical protein
MKLNKDTKYDLEIGDILVDDRGRFKEVITNMWTSENGKVVYVTLLCIKDAEPVGRNWSMYGRVTYGTPTGQLYGLNIIKPEDFTDEDIAAIEDLGMQGYYDWA